MISIEKSTLVRRSMDALVMGQTDQVAGVIPVPEYDNLGRSIVCDDFVFRQLQWGTENKRAFELDPKTFLERKGFKLAEDKPRRGDIVLYACDTAAAANQPADDMDFEAFERRRIAKPPYFVHVGLWDGQAVLSRIYKRVYHHPIEAVPSCLGTQVYVFRAEAD